MAERNIGFGTLERLEAGSRKQGNGKNRKLIEKITWVETKTVSTAGGEVQVRLIAKGGRIG